MNQVYPISPTMLYVVVDAVIHLWISVVAEKEAVPERFVRDVQNITAYLYAENGLLIP